MFSHPSILCVTLIIVLATVACDDSPPRVIDPEQSTSSATLLAFDALSGKELWRTRTRAAAIEVAVEGANLVVEGGDACDGPRNINALYTRDGVFTRFNPTSIPKPPCSPTLETPGNALIILSIPDGAESQLLPGSDGRDVHRVPFVARDRSSGLELWRVMIPVMGSQPAQAVVGDTVAIVPYLEIADGNRLLALDVTGGRELWQKSIDGWVPASYVQQKICVSADTVYFLRPGRLQAFDALTGAMRWETTASVPSHGHGAIQCDESTIVAFDPTTVAAFDAAGTSRWAALLPGGRWPANGVLADGVFYIGLWGKPLPPRSQ